MAVTQGMRLSGKSIEGIAKGKPDRIPRGKTGPETLGTLAKFAWELRQLLWVWSVPALDSSFVGLPNFVPFY